MPIATSLATSPAGVVSFDLDDTLIRGPFGRVIDDVAEAVAGSPEEAAEIRAQIRAGHQALLGVDDLASYDWHQIVADCIGDRDPGFDMLDRLEEYASQGVTRILHADTPALLARLQAAGWRVVVLTNGWRRYQEPVLRHAGLLAAIDELVTSDDVGVAKPDAATFRRARGGAAHHVHVGDRMDHDIVGGNAADAQTVLLRVDAPDDPAELDSYLAGLRVKFKVSERDREFARPDFVSNSLADVVGWVSALPVRTAG